jgi:hypothetical protein
MKQETDDDAAKTAINPATFLKQEMDVDTASVSDQLIMKQEIVGDANGVSNPAASSE